MASSDVVTKTDVANWTACEDATEEVKKYTAEVSHFLS